MSDTIVGRSLRRSTLGSIAIITTLSLALVMPVQAGNSANSVGVIQWRSGAVATPAQDADTIGAALESQRSSATHFVVQFNRPLTLAERELTTGAGLNLLSYLGDNAFFASLNQGRADVTTLTELDVLRCVLPIQTEWKLHSAFITGDIPDFALVSDSKTAGLTPTERKKLGLDESDAGEVFVAGYVLFHRDVDLERVGPQAVRYLGGRVRSYMRSINGLVVELPQDQLWSLGSLDAVRWFGPPLPKMSTCNDSNRALTGADIVQEAPYGLDGTGIVALIYDAGTADSSHADFSGRCTERDSSGVHYHSTHVAGTVGGDGTESGGTYRGMAPNCTLESYGFEQEGGLQEGFLYTDPGDIEADYSEAISVYGADIANNSIGTNTASNGFPCDWTGNYGPTSELIDTIVRGDGSNPLFSTPFRIVWANGNERQTSRCGESYASTAPPACAKNHITVGALNSNDESMTDFSSWGPTDDGRIKPDISAPGCQSDDDNGVTSCNSGGGYTSLCGTSMAAPTVCGLSVLLLQDYRNQFPGEPDFRNSTLKAILANTAADETTAEDNPGPDYLYGYGSVRIEPAIQVIRNQNFVEAEVSQGEVYSVVVIADPGTPELKVTLAWDDYPADPDVDNTLVNDLDLHVYDSADNRYYPWTLDPENPSNPAIQTEEDHVNNIEQVVIQNPGRAGYRVEIHGYNVPFGPQSFSVCATPLLVNCSSAGTIALDRSKYACSAIATVRVVDCDLNTDDGTVQTVDVTVVSDSDPTGETITLVENAPESAAFEGELPLETTDGDGVLVIAAGDTITATYIDADDGQGNYNVVVTDEAVIDCTPPIITNVQVSETNPRDATITFETDEPASAMLHWGLSCDALDETVSGIGLRTEHSIRITGLEDNMTYFFTVDATDEAGNFAADDNGGSCYSFTTPEVPDFFTELFTGDNDLANLSLLFVPNSSVDFYAGCVVGTIEDLPTDPAGGTTISLGDDSSEEIALTGGASVWLYGTEYASVYVCSNGYITFGGSDTTYSESLENHFNMPRISALFDDLNPSSAGTVSYQQLEDRLVITWLNVTEYSESNSNTFQIELFFDGTISISYLELAVGDCVAGLSEGEGLDPDYLETDLSDMGSCGPRPPIAANVNVTTLDGLPMTIDLLPSDDGLPEPPALSCVIETLPDGGELLDATDAHVILAEDLPYTLINNGNAVIYRRFPAQAHVESFLYHANDGGTPPDGGDSSTATVTVTIGGNAALISFPFDTDPGWSVEGEWAFGQPTGEGSHNYDPTSGYTGDYVYGYNLEGDYDNSIPVYYLTSASIDFSNVLDGELRFWRWLGVESSTWDHADLAISTDGDNWTTLWEHSGSSISDTSWSQQTFDISTVADGQAAVWFRWSMGPTDTSVTYPGWNIDDLEIWGLAPPPLGDMNCDGAVNFDDIDGFVTAMVGEEGYYAEYPDCNYWYADTNSDDFVNFDDIEDFVTAIVGGA